MFALSLAPASEPNFRPQINTLLYALVLKKNNLGVPAALHRACCPLTLCWCYHQQILLYVGLYSSDLSKSGSPTNALKRKGQERSRSLGPFFSLAFALQKKDTANGPTLTFFLMF